MDIFALVTVIWLRLHGFPSWPFPPEPIPGDTGNGNPTDLPCADC